ncbi:MAG: HD domain-containing phosphohydrolase, partial [Acidobacteriota bacterium]
MSLFTKAFISLVTAVGVIAIGYSVLEFQSNDPVRYLTYLVIALLASGLKVSMPAVTGTLSVSFVFVLVGILELSLSETMILGCATTLVQCIWKPAKRPALVQVVFNVAVVAAAIASADAVCHSAFLSARRIEEPILILTVTAVFFLVNSAPVAVVIGLTERLPVIRVWRECYFWAFPYYLAGAGIAGVFGVLNRLIGWQTSTMALPVVYLIYRAYRLYLGRLDDETNHAEEMTSLHLRTIEALALAIEAKDHQTHDHLQRVQVYAVEIGRDLGLNQTELEALQAASVLHDIGKLAVPEHIISKPGRLTPEEFEKMKIHPVVGAEILEQVQFPYPVAP